MKTKSLQLIRNSSTSGFSLIEVLVSLSIFTIVVTISVGSLLVLIDANAKSQSMQVVMTNLNFTLDSMTREIRTGDGYFCASENALPQFDANETAPAVRDCDNGDVAFSFREGAVDVIAETGSRRIAYRLVDDATGAGQIQRRLGDGVGESNGGWFPITAADVDIETLRFVVTGSDRFYDPAADTQTPVVTIFIAGTVRQGEVSGSAFSIQTTVAQSSLDI